VTIEVQCTSCHTRYRIDEQVLPEGTPTFKCSRCGHVFTIEPRAEAQTENVAEPAVAAQPRAKRRSPEARDPDPAPQIGEKNVPDAQSGWVVDSAAEDSIPAPKIATDFDQAEGAPLSASSTPPAAAKPSTDELLSKPFHQDVSETGENLKFDFSDDRLEHEVPVADEFGSDRHSSEWQVGEPELETSLQSLNAARPRASTPGEGKANAAAPEPRARRVAMRASKPAKPAEDEEFLDEDSAPIYNRGAMTHSARFVVALFVLIAFGYGVIAVLIRSAPATAAGVLSHLPKIGDRFILPIAPARIVAMRDVHADYLRTKGGHTALVVTGMAENVGGKPLHAVQIAAILRDASRRSIANSTVYCGNNLSAAMVAQMTPHELEFFQKLDPPKTFTLDPSATSPFVIVFIDPPAAVSGFDVSVASAGAGTAPPAETTSG
jgi:predicted Zn finger-like uncharacterized protein